MQVSFTSVYRVDVSEKIASTEKRKAFSDYFIDSLNSSDEDIRKDKTNYKPKKIRRVMHSIDKDYRRPKLNESIRGTDRGAVVLKIKDKTYILTGQDCVEFNAFKKDLKDKNASVAEFRRALREYRSNLHNQGRIGSVLLTGYRYRTNEDENLYRLTKATVTNAGQDPKDAGNISINVLL